MTFEQALQQGMFSRDNEKTFIDKLLAREDVNKVKELIKKPKLTREELLELLYLLSSTEAKLLNYGEWDRYIILKFFVWIREFVMMSELLFDYQDDLKIKENTCTKCSLLIKTDHIKKCVCEEPIRKIVLSDRTRKLLSNNERLIEHNAKFLIDLYFNIARTTLSLGATGLLEILKNKYEIAYPQGQIAQQLPQEKPGLFSFGGK